MEHVWNLKMAKQKLDELEDFDDVCESMYFVPDQYPRPYCSEVYCRQSTLPVGGEIFQVHEKKLTFGEKIPWNVANL